MALAPNHLVTLADQRAWLGIKASVVEPDLDLIIETCINSASSTIEKYIDRKLILNTVTKRYDGNNRLQIELGEWPVRNIISVHESVSWVFDTTTLIDPTRYRITDDEIFVAFKDKFNRNGTQNVQVVFEYGYDSPSNPLLYPLDSVLKHCTLSLTEHIYNVRNDRRVGVSSKSKNSENVSFIDGIPLMVSTSLDYFKRDFFIPDTRAVPLR
jgi:hypothetical protein